jgi:hypothetical protein
MTKLPLLIGGLFILFLTQAIAFVQTNGQFVWPWFKENPYKVSLVFGFVISVGFITSARFITEYYDGALWPARLYSFSIGVVAFAVMAFLLKGEGITLKTAICLILAACIAAIQVLWK